MIVVRADPPRRRGRPVSLKKRQAMIDAAVAEFGEMGFGNAGMDAIASRAKVSKRTLYNRFSSKEALFGYPGSLLSRGRRRS